MWDFNTDKVTGNITLYAKWDISAGTQNVIKLIDSLDITDVQADNVINAIKAFEALSESEKTNVPDELRKKMESAKEAVARKLNTGSKIAVEGLPWSVQVQISPINPDENMFSEIAGKLNGKTLVSLYDVDLLDLYNNGKYEIPAGQSVKVTIEAPDLTGYENIMIIHEKADGTVEYITPENNNGVLTFTLSSLSPIGISADKTAGSSAETAGGNVNMLIIISALAGICIAVFLVLYLRKRRGEQTQA